MAGQLQGNQTFRYSGMRCIIGGPPTVFQKGVRYNTVP